MSFSKFPRPSSIAWTLCILGLVSLLGIYVSNQKTLKQEDNSPIATNGAVGGPFTLTDQHGKTVTEKSWPNKTLLLYFGFTHCPDVCPTGLNKIAEALNQLPKEKLDKIQPLLITVDPARDKAADLKVYVSLFHPKLIGLTGTDAQIEKIKSEFKVYAQKQGSGDDYMVNHSAFTYLWDPYKGLIGLYSHDTTAEDMSKQINKAIK